ncbi:MAG: hypothetical protein E4H31_00340 [Dehalococcoidia bacterium]|nr:MAG: hypothetical protein E4H31_00340 [Dehalococcoidia bacterium]
MSNIEAEDKAMETDQEEHHQELPSLDLVYVEVKDRLEVQLRQIDALDGKSGTLMFVSSVVIGMGAAAQAAILGTFHETLPMVLFSVPIIFYVMSVMLVMRSWIRRPYFRDPEPRPLRDYYSSQPYEFTKRRLITHFISSYEWNAMVMKKKVNELRYAVWFFLLQVVSLTLVLASRPWLSIIFGE